jgi:hypothetical protein
MEEKTNYTTKEMQQLPFIPFTTNWNNKLDCKAFTTIRIRNDEKYKIGHKYCITLNKLPQFVAEIVSITHFQLNSITPAMSYLDTGYGTEETKKIIEKMYKKYNIAVYNVTWYFILLVHKLLSENE